MPKMDLSQNYRFGNRLYRAGRDVEIPADLYAQLNTDGESEESADNDNQEDEGALSPNVPGRAALLHAGYESDEDVKGLSRDELIAVKGIGPNTADAILEFYAQ